MGKLLLVRHGESVGNSKGIIQGLTDFPLTENGKDSVKRIVDDNYELFKDKSIIMSSPLIRASQTSELIASRISKEIVYDELLKEFSAGILDGVSKREAEAKYKTYFDIWKKRRDLDLIPGSESGKHLQARVLIFLEQYLYRDYNDIIVSHAGFMRSFINTIRGVSRTTPIPLDHGNIYEVSNLFDSINIEDYVIAKNSIVKSFETYEDKYIIKRVSRELNNQDINEKNILDYLANYIDVSRVIEMGSRGSGYSLKTMDFKEGVNIHGDLTRKQIENTTLELYKMMQALHNYGDLDGFAEVDMLRHVENNILNSNSMLLKRMGLDILKDNRFVNGVGSDERIIVHDDLHRDNILYNGTCVTFLDFEGVKIYPSTYQLASHIAASYILNDANFNIDNILKYWPSSIDKEYLVGLIKYRLYDGLVYFQNRIDNKNYSSDDVSFRDKYVRCLKKIR